MAREDTIKKAMELISRVHCGETYTSVCEDIHFGKTAKAIFDRANAEGGTLYERAVRLCDYRNEVCENSRKKDAPAEKCAETPVTEPITAKVDFPLRGIMAAFLMPVFIYDGKDIDQAAKFAVIGADTLLNELNA